MKTSTALQFEAARLVEQSRDLRDKAANTTRNEEGLIKLERASALLDLAQSYLRIARDLDADRLDPDQNPEFDGLTRELPPLPAEEPFEIALLRAAARQLKEQP